MNILKFLLVLAYCLVLVVSDPKNLEEMQQIAEAGITMDFTGKWWKTGFQVSFDGKRLRVAEKDLLNGEIATFKSLKIGYAKLHNKDKVYFVGNQDKVEVDGETYHTFTLQRMKLILTDFSAKEMMEAAQGKMSLRIKAKDLSKTLKKEDLEIVLRHGIASGFRVKPKILFHGVRGQFNVSGSIIGLSNAVTSTGVALKLKVTVKNLIYFYFKAPTGVLHVDEHDIKLVYTNGKDEPIKAPQVTVYASFQSANCYMQVGIQLETVPKIEWYQDSKGSQLQGDGNWFVYFDVE